MPAPMRPAVWRYVLHLLIEGWDELPWQLDRLLGIGLFGFGFVLWFWPEESIRNGFRYVKPIIHPFAVLVSLFGFLQVLVGVAEWAIGRRVVAFLAFFLYAGFTSNRGSHASMWMFCLGVIGEGLIVLRRY